MAIYVALDHSMRYDFDRPVQLFPHVVRLFPAPHTRTPIYEHRVEILGPEEFRVFQQQDAFGNVIARVVATKPTTALEVKVHLTADMTVINPFDFFVEGYAEIFPFDYDTLLRSELKPYLEVVEDGPTLRAWVKQIDRRPRHIVDFLVELNAKLQQRINYTVRMEPGVQTCEQTFERSLGSCRDTGWLLVQILRHLGLAARFVSGYLVQLRADEKSLDGPSGTEKDFTDLHAWAEVYVPGAGWIGLDPTSGLFAGEGHIPLACTPDPISAAPLTGATGKCEVEFSHSNEVSRFHEDPRVTRPYTDEQWEAIRALGRSMDKELDKLDVRLTMGGEPTFVSIDDMEGAEWNTEALGAAKRQRAGLLLQRLQKAFAPGGLLHYGMGKWYPGEPLPRWALGCFWRPDGVPLWREPKWLADETKDYGFGPAEARRFAERLSLELGLEPGWLVEGREDWAHYLWREAAQPANIDAITAPGSTQFRDDMSLVLARGLDRPSGYALPLAFDAVQGGTWCSGSWEFPRGAMYLTPGSSPMGLRLPLNELPWAQWSQARPKVAAPRVTAAPVAARPKVAAAPRVAAAPVAAPRVAAVAGVTQPRPTAFPVAGAPLSFAAAEQPDVALADVPADDSPAEVPAADAPLAPPPGTPPGEWGWWSVPHTALCIEPRDGKLYLFMPHFTALHPYELLLSAIEKTAAALGMPVLTEGYEPPRNPKLQSFKVTPDPGVIEVNIHPARSWEQLEHNTVTLYSEARLSRLGTEKFMLDGRHTGTGGGNHITLGGVTPQDSPFLRRPDLLRSFITYWQHHPSLSYLFSGLFIGPTSQAPRVDERGSHQLAELECSFAEIDRGVDPSLIDGCLRNFLTDVMGNTHRAEFCIDKLFSPDSAAGRQGLLEFRGFEMPPHARMSLAQTLLLRTLVVRFWKQPYRHPLVRWGTALHDRFMLPEAIWADFQDVIGDCNAAGYPFDLHWFDPFLEFRFPLYGRATYDGVELELRMALEPWPVLGDPNALQGQSRDVDSSVERLQVKARGLDPERYLLTCNGRRLPLRPTGKNDELFAGVRYKSWQSSFGLHPTLPGDAPLVVDLFDRRLGRTVGGCVYHCDHPGGRNYEVFPVNPFEAEARRIGRFWAWGHTPGEPAAPPWVSTLQDFYGDEHARSVREPAQELPNPEYPYTLDLRRVVGS